MTRSPLARLAVAAGALELFLSVGALGGGAALVLGPRGEVIPLPLSLLAGSPFGSYRVPGLILFVVLGVGPLTAAVLTFRHHPWGPLLAVAVGAALLVWLAVEIAIVGYSNKPPLQALYLALAVAILLVGVAWWRTTRKPPAPAPASL